MKVGVIVKQPAERKWYSIDYSAALDPEDRLSSIDAVLVEPYGLQATAVITAQGRVRVLISEGVNGVVYKVTIRVQTIASEIWEDELVVRIKEV